jgi:hypothetical protein
VQRGKHLDDEGEQRGKSKRVVERKFEEPVEPEKTGRFWCECDGDEVNGEGMREVKGLYGHLTGDGCKGAFGD